MPSACSRWPRRKKMRRWLPLRCCFAVLLHQEARCFAPVVHSQRRRLGLGAVVAVTRELGKNDELRKRLHAGGLSVVEVPCVAQVRDAAGEAELDAMLARSWRWAVVTSPEAAAALSDAVERVDGDALPAVATVGAASARALRCGLSSSFSPSKATAATLAAELPGDAGDAVLFPASKLAARVLQDSLTARGFRVTRVDAYTTVPAAWDADLEAAARSADVVAFGSPSAVDVWRDRLGPAAAVKPVCIGQTTALACADFSPAPTFPAKPGLPGWADEIFQAAAHPPDNVGDSTEQK